MENIIQCTQMHTSSVIKASLHELFSHVFVKICHITSMQITVNPDPTTPPPKKAVAQLLV